MCPKPYAHPWVAQYSPRIEQILLYLDQATSEALLTCPYKVISGSMTKVTCSMTKEELHHFHLVFCCILLVKS